MAGLNSTVYFRTVPLVLVFLFGASIGAGQDAPATKPTTTAPAKSTSAETSAEPTEDKEARVLSNAILTKKHPELTEAWEKLKSKDRAAALKVLNDSRAKTPTLPPAELLIARYYLDLGNVVQGLRELDEAVDKNPEDPGAFLDLAGIAILQGRNTEAILLLERAEKLLATIPPTHPHKKAMTVIVNNQWAAVHERFKHWAKVRDRLLEVIKVDPQNARAHYRLGTAWFELKEGKKGLAEYEKAYEQNNKLHTPPIAVAIFFLRSNQTKEADEWLKWAEKAYGSHSETRMFLALTEWQRGHLEEAKRHTAAAAAADPKSASVLLFEGVLAHYARDLKLAEEKLEAALKLAPYDVQTRDQLAKVLIQSADQPKREQALTLAQEAVQLSQNNRDMVATLGWVLYNSGRSEQAMQALSYAVQLPPTGDSAYFAASILADRKETANAIKLLESVLRAKELFVHRPDAEKLLSRLKS